MASDIECVIFDLSEVCIRGIIGVEGVITRYSGVPEEEVHKHLTGEKLQLMFEGRISENEYWKRVSKEGKYNLAVTFFEEAVRHNFIELPGTVDIVKKVKEEGYRIGLLSDHSQEWIGYIESIFPFMQLFDERCYSYQCHATKKDPTSFAYALSILGAQGHSTLFIDDNLKNLNVAEVMGIRYLHHFKGAEGLEQALKEMEIRGF